MDEQNLDSEKQITLWVEKLEQAIVKQERLYIESDPKCKPYEARDLFLINKIATLTVALKETRAEIDKLKALLLGGSPK